MIDINELMDESSHDMDTTMVPISKVVELTNVYDNIINRLLNVLHQHEHGGNHRTLDTVVSNDLNHRDIYLLDYENIGNFPALMHTWNKPNDQVYCFMNKQLIAHFDQQLNMVQPSLQERIHPIVLSTSGINALDIAIAMFVGYISAKYEPNGIYIYTNDKGYHVLLEICRFWGIDNVEIRLSIGPKEEPIRPLVQPVKPVVRPEPKLVKPAPQPPLLDGFTIGKPLHITKSKGKSEQKLNECKAFIQLLNDHCPLVQPYKNRELCQWLLEMFPKTDRAKITQLISRCLSFGLMKSKNGKIVVN